MSHLAILLGVGIPVFVGTLLLVVFLAVRGAINRTRAELEREGIVLDSGPLWLTIRLSGFRGGGMAAGVGVRKNRVSLLLTGQRLAILPPSRPYSRLDHDDLKSFTVSVGSDGRVRLRSESPPRGSGTIEYSFAVKDATAWVTALASAGARRAS